MGLTLLQYLCSPYARWRSATAVKDSRSIREEAAILDLVELN